MRVTLKKKKVLNNKFNLEGLIVLGYDQLLKVNGAGGSSGSSGGSSSGPSSSSSSSSSGNLSDRGYPSSTDYNPGTPSSNGPYTGGSSTPSNPTNPNPQPKDYIVTKGDPDQVTNITTFVESTIVVHSDDKYVVSCDPNKEWRCDNYAEAIVTQSGGDANKIFAGDPTKKTVEDHINYGKENNNLQGNDKKSAPTLTDGAYVVFMDDSYVISAKTNLPLEDHCGIMIVQNGTVSFSDNSSNNNNGAGGASTADYNSLQSFQNDYGYNNFYYQKITEKR